MTIPDWPSGVPHEPVMGSWQVDSLSLPPVATDMDGGNTRQRRRPGGNVATVTQTIRMTSEELQEFKEFYLNELAEGVSRFNATVWAGEACLERECQFAAQPTISARGTKKFLVGMQLRVYGGLVAPPPPSMQKLLLHFDGADGSTVFTDSSPVPHTVTPSGNAQIDTAQSVFGGASALFDGNDHLSLDGSSDFAFGTNDFTIDFRFRTTTTSGFGVLYDTRPSGTPGAHQAIYRDTTSLKFHTNGSEVISGGTIAINTWHHVALTRSAGQTRLFVDGSQIGSTFADSSDYVITASRPRIGLGGDTGTNGHNGWVDELRVLNGIAAWSANFTPPTSAYETD